jgi:hypothetical protein
MTRYANKERGLKEYVSGKTLYGFDFNVQDGSLACFPVVRIYFEHKDNWEKEIKLSCLYLKKAGALKLIKGLQKFIDNN